jgi:hypothetical protein
VRAEPSRGAVRSPSSSWPTSSSGAIDDLLAEAGGTVTGTPLDWLGFDRLDRSLLDLGVFTRSPLRSPFRAGVR